MMTQQASTVAAHRSVLASRAVQSDSLAIPVTRTPVQAQRSMSSSPVDSVRTSAVERCTTMLSLLEPRHPEWFDDYAHCESDLAARGELASLVRTAPDAFLAGMAYGKLAMRIELSFITGRQGGESVDPAFVAEMAGVMANFEKLDPEWFDRFARVDADLGAEAELFELMSTAPHNHLLGFLYGKLMTRIELRVITGR